ncbi:MAG: thiamine-phosphate kinase [Betaproteobacteria bacterium]|nr:thiamine-phosphate kinase [Betaproteobacteria bacterium]
MSSEFALIARYFTPGVSHTAVAGGDDAALLAPTPGRQLAVTTDMLVEGVHFLAGADPESLGHKTLAVNLSDLAAMGAQPRWAFLAMALPDAGDEWCEAFSRGLLALARRFDVDLAGGDTTKGPRNLCVTAIGEVAPDRALRRSAARIGDDIYVSGCTGEAAFGLRTYREATGAHSADVRHCRRRLDRPEPRVSLGTRLAGVAQAAIDVSDGLLADLGHVCEASNAGAELQWDRLPHSSALATLSPQDRAAAVLGGGDDYELIVTAPERSREAVSRIASESPVALTRIGRIVEGPGVRVFDRSGCVMDTSRSGYDHFR